ncbi:hypothetical protein DIPPA_29969 [Diplonema papillatum]|nr:hypothetical protein DIPPA_29969 [Diplonema papillatum]
MAISSGGSFTCPSEDVASSRMSQTRQSKSFHASPSGGVERRIGVCRIADMSEFDRALDSQPSFCDEATCSSIGGSRHRHSVTPSRMVSSEPNGESFKLLKENEKRKTLSDLVSVDLACSGAATNPRVSKNGRQYDPARYGSIDSASFHSPFAQLSTRTNASSRIRHRFGAPLLSISEASSFAFVVVFGLAIASQDMDYTAKGCVSAIIATACFATNIAVNGYILTLGRKTDDVALDADAAARLISCGWSSETVESFEVDLSKREDENQMENSASIKDLFRAFGLHVFGSVLPCLPIFFSTMLQGENLVPVLVVSGVFTFFLFGMTLLYQTSCSAVRYFTSPTASFAFLSLAALCASVAGVAFALREALDEF